MRMMMIGMKWEFKRNDYAVWMIANWLLWTAVLAALLKAP